MPYKSEKINLNKQAGLDLRVKVTEADKQKIRELHGQIPIRAIARAFPHISRRMIQFILFPERLKKVAERAKETKRWEKYNKKEYHTPVMKKTRKHKQELYLKGLIK